MKYIFLLGLLSGSFYSFTQTPLNLWERKVDDHQFGGWVFMYPMGENLLVASSHDNDSTNVPAFYLERSAAISIINQEGEVLNSTYLYDGDYPVYRSLDIRLTDSLITVGGTLEVNDTLIPIVMQLDLDLNLISSEVSEFYAVRPDISVSAVFRSSGVIKGESFYQVNPSAVLTRDSARIFVTCISLDGTTDVQLVHEVKPLIGEYRSLHFSPSTGFVVSKGNGGMVLLDEQFLGTGYQYFSNTNDATSPESPENNDEFYFTGAECTDGAATEINGVFYQANASIGYIDGVLYTATIVEKWSPTRGFLARAAVNIDTFTWAPSTCFDWLAAGLGRNAIVGDGADGIYLVSNVMKELHTYVAHCDTNLNVRWRRDWQNEEVQFAHSAAVVEGYDGVYIASIRNPDNSFVGQGSLILNRIPSDGGEVITTSKLGDPGQHGRKVLLYPNPATAGTSLMIEGERGDFAYARLLDMTGKMIHVDVTSDLRIQLPQGLGAGTYTCLLFNSRNELVTNQKLIVQ